MAEIPESSNLATQQLNESDQNVIEEERSLLRWRWKRKHKNIQQKKNTIAGLADPERTVCFVSIDAGMGSDLLNMRVLKRLEELLPEQGDSGKRLCHLENLSIR
jgi:hypothetical protein